MSKLAELLERTSRTFALAIPLLPQPTRQEVTIAYLLFRIADTFEDGERWPAQKRSDALGQFCRLVEDPRTDACVALAKQWTDAPPTSDEDYRALLAETGTVFAAFRALPASAREILAEHVTRTARGMAAVVRSSSASGRLQLESVDELRHYCYLVAGIVGEMLTELFLLDRPGLEPIAGYLRERSQAFGEGLQLVNILKDSDDDARDGRSYLPAGVPRDDLMALAERDLDRATEYSTALQELGAERGLVAFTALPVMLARAALQRLEEDGPGAKVPRHVVMALYAQMQDRLNQGRPVFGAPPVRDASAGWS